MKYQLKVTPEKVGQDGWDRRYVVRLNGMYVNDFKTPLQAHDFAGKIEKKARAFQSVGGLGLIQ